MSLAKNLNFRINEKGEILGRISKSADEFVFSTEIIELLKSIQKNTSIKNKEEVLELETLLKKNLKKLYETAPNSKEIEKIIEDLFDAKMILAKKNVKTLSTNLHGFSDPWIQWAMLSDTIRCSEYFNALKNLVVKNKTCLLDLGAGTGLLSYMALKLGAKKAYLIEQGDTSEYIPRIFQKLGISKNRYQIFKKNSQDVIIPKDTTLVVHELFGNDPFEEGLLNTLSDLEDKVNFKKITFLPQSLDVFFSFVEIKEASLNNRMRAFYNIDTLNIDSSIKEFLSHSKKILPFDSLSFPLKLEKNDFNYISDIIEVSHKSLVPPITKHSNPCIFKMKVNKDCHYAFGLLWFKSKLTKENYVTSNPKDIKNCSHWSPICIALKEKVYTSDVLTVKSFYDPDDEKLRIEIYKEDALIAAR